MYMEIKGALKIIVLKILNEKDFTGYGLIKEVKTKTGFWKPSPGSMYPLMNDLLKKGLVTYKKNKNKKIYSITHKGKKVYEKIIEKKEEILNNLIGGIKFLETIGEDKKELKYILGFLKEFEKGNLPFKENCESLIEFKRAFFEAAKNKKNSKKINKILKDASKKLSKLQKAKK